MNVFAEKLIDPSLLPLLNKIKFQNYKPTIIGSYSLQSQHNAGDIDIDINITGQIDQKLTENELKKIIKEIDENLNMYFIELKIQYKNGKKKKFYANDIDRVKIPKKNFDNIEFIKLDLVIFFNGEFKELSVNYWFNPNKIDVVNEIKASIAEEKKEGRYFKAVKRYFSIAKILNDYNKGKYISEYLNNYYGTEYKILSNLKAIKLLLENYDDPLIRLKIRKNLIDINIIPKVSIINNLIKKIQKKVDDDGYKFLKTFESKYI